MQTWEYIFVRVDMARGTRRPRYVNGEQLQNWKQGVSISEYANELGSQGWELIGSSVAGFELIFKRPKA